MAGSEVSKDVDQRIDDRLDELHGRYRSTGEEGRARYYSSGRGYLGPQHAGEQHSTFGLALANLDGQVRGTGDDEVMFPLQSISKVFAYALALQDNGHQQVMQRVGVEPSGDDFSSIVFDENAHRPYNPMVNVGALVTVDLVQGRDINEKCDRIVEIIRRCAGNQSIHVDEEIFARELQSADRNRGVAYLLRSENMLDGAAEDVLALYLRQCSITVSCRDLALMAATLANGGTNPLTGEGTCDRRLVRDVLSVMYTCGMYDFAGEWAFDIGVPAKSGVSGGILVPIPGKMGVGVFSPGLDEHGNSMRGINVCQEISGRLGLHVFAADEEDTMLESPSSEPMAPPAVSSASHP